MQKIFKTKTIILHDTFLYKGGGERLILVMAKSLESDIASGFFSSGSFDLRKEGFTGKMIEISSEIFKKGLRHIQLKLAFLLKTKFLQNYDTIIFSGDCISAIKNCNKNSKKIFYCHTPPRYLYDLREIYLKKVCFPLRGLFNAVSYIFRKMYEAEIKRFDLVITNSQNTRQRLKYFTNIDSKVLYPPVDLQKFKWKGQSDYYLSCARLSSAKRVDKIVKAFIKMPSKKLIVIYGENDPQKNEIFEIGKGYKNIKFITLAGNVGFLDYVGNCIASIYVPIDEDFGMISIESMAAGKPVLGVAEGGLKETILDKKTGILISPGAEIQNIIDAVNYLTPKKCLEMKKNCEKRANDFGLEKFEKKLKQLVRETEK